MTEAIFRERLQAIIDWADLAMKNRAVFDSHGVRNLDGPVFDAAREALASTSPPKTNPIGYISRDTFAELLHDNSGEYKIVTPEDLIMVEGSIADYVPIFSLPGAHPSDPPPQDHVAGVPEDLLKLTFAIQHNPNCPSQWLVRLPGKSGSIDMKPYRDLIGIVPHQTGDILGFGKTLDEAARAALAASEVKP
jgi:hypothetical protein